MDGVILFIFACTTAYGAVLSATSSLENFSQIFNDAKFRIQMQPFETSTQPISSMDANQPVNQPDYRDAPGVPSLPSNQIPGQSWPGYPQIPNNQGNWNQPPKYPPYLQCQVCRPCGPYAYRSNGYQNSTDDSTEQTTLFQDGTVKVVERQTKVNSDGTQENRLVLSNGLVIYQKVGMEPKDNTKMSILEGFYSQKITDRTYLTTFYKVNQRGYLIKSGVSMSPPKVSSFKDLTPSKEES